MMDQKQLKQLSRVIDRACKKHLAAGGTLICGRYWDENEQHCCPIRATVLYGKKRPWLWQLAKIFSAPVEPLPSPERLSYSEQLSEVLDFRITIEEVASIVRGIDSKYVGWLPPEKVALFPFFELGRSITERFHPVISS